MNWIEIKKKYPKGLNKLFEWLNIEEYESSINKEAGTQWYQFEHSYLLSHEGFCWNVRNLYNFFDEQEIYANVHSDMSIDLELYWTWDIHEKANIGQLIYEPFSFTSRSEAEEKLFSKAFERLEKKLA